MLRHLRHYLRRVPKLDGRKLDHRTLEEIRVRAIHAVQGGHHPDEVVRALGLGRRCIYNWLAAYGSAGLGALKAKELLGRPMKLRPKQLKSLYDLVVDQTPLQHRFEFALWTLDVVLADRRTFSGEIEPVQHAPPDAPDGIELSASATPHL
jgi:transposase